MSEQPQVPQPSSDVIIRIQRQEINRINDNRIVLLSTLDETISQANTEIGRLNGEISRLISVANQLKTMLSDDLIEEAETIIAAAQANQGVPTKDD